jgi:spore germination protein GerM
VTGRRLVAVAVALLAAGLLGWLLMSALGRFLRSPAESPAAPGADVPAVAAPPAGPTAAGPKIKATLFFASEDGQRLVGVETEVPLAEGTVAQARSIVETLLAAAPSEPLSSTIPPGTLLRGVYVSAQNEVFVDLDDTVRSAHPGGSMRELLTVYGLVNTLLVNLPTIAEVQILINGHEVETLAGHVDLRRPLRKTEGLIAAPIASPPSPPS